ncbi:hypothetical protein RA28_12930 [Ruegeria sp. ANG-S4]|uniref:hypothetical protein n=1 Tax=Ruegeria sp. ANG-S4 TaxID=1577904 RepID=UPI00057C8A16|nr:hypothetical protein [Ruegeria sp. ANG-S4]KIC45350.1 hypothetical protein RA28_12930 [Ruegeria sp. ANG-S4]
MSHEPKFSITEEMISFHEESSGATEALLENLNSAIAGARLSSIVAKVTAIVAREFGVEIEPDQALTLPGVKAAVIGGGSLDRDTIIASARNKVPSVAYAAGNWAQETDDDHQKPANWNELPPAERINWARRRGLA